MNSASSVKQTSRSSYYDQVISGKAKSQRERILELLRTDNLPPHNRREISLRLHIPINAVCGRVRAMIDNGDIRVAYIAEDPQTNKRVEYLEFIHSSSQARLF